MALPTFIHEDATQVLAEIKARYELLASRQLSDGDAEMLLLNALAYREMLLRSGINHTGRQSLLQYSSGSMLDFLGQLLDVQRLDATPALCNITFTLVDGHSGITVPKGTRVQSIDGKVVFVTNTDTIVAAGALTALIACTCITDGLVGNGYSIGQISIIVSPIAFVSAASNTTVTQGGADVETDDSYKQRVQLAPSKFSTAGPEDAYKYFALSANQSIVDVAVMSSTPGTVQVYPLLNGGLLPTTAIINQVAEVLNDKKVRPLTDTVTVAAPTSQAYTIEVGLTLFNGQNASEVQGKVQQLLLEYTNSKKNKLGVDIVASQIVAVCMLPNVVYKCNVVAPAIDVVVANNVYTNCTAITVTINGFANG